MSRASSASWETHRIRSRDWLDVAEFRRAAALVAMRYGENVTVEVPDEDDENDEPDLPSCFETVDDDRTVTETTAESSTVGAATAEPTAETTAETTEETTAETATAVETAAEPGTVRTYETPLSAHRAAVATMLGAAVDAGDWPVSRFAVHAGSARIFEMTTSEARPVASVNAAPVERSFETRLRRLATDYDALLVPLDRLGRWTDGERWYDLVDGRLCVSADERFDRDDESSGSNRTCYDVVELDRIHISDDDLVVELSWTRAQSLTDDGPGPLARLGALVRSDRPTRLTFEDEAAFRTASSALTTAVGVSSR